MRLPAVCTAIAIALSCGAALAAPIADESTYVAAVEVVQKDTDAPAGFADALREAVLKETPYFGATGRPIVLRIDIDRVHFKNAAAAMLIGDDNATRGHVSVVDQASGEELGNFRVDVDAEKPGDFATEVGLDIAGAFDPTGAVDIAHAAGDAASADINRSGTGKAMIVNFVAEVLEKTFGRARARAAIDNAEHASGQH